ncbi:hypothetical protein ACFL2H_05185 [Planctomycetota bacterium]
MPGFEVLESGESEAAKTLKRFRDGIVELNHESHTFSNLSLDDQLIDAYAEACEPNWEGEGSIRVEPSTLQLAKEFVESLPRKYQIPEISPEPDGHVNLEWYNGKRRLLSVSVNPDGRLHWASLIGTEDPRGSCVFFGEAPKTLLHLLSRVCRG